MDVIIAFFFVSAACQPVLPTFDACNWVFCQYVMRDLADPDLWNGDTFKMLTLLTMNHSYWGWLELCNLIILDTVMPELGETIFPNIMCK